MLSAFIKLRILCQAEIEEAKAQEIIKLQQSLEAMQSKIEESNALIQKEREAAQKAIEEASSIVHETPVPVEDTAKIESLTEEIEKLKVMTLKCVIIPSHLSSLFKFSSLYKRKILSSLYNIITHRMSCNPKNNELMMLKGNVPKPSN